MKVWTPDHTRIKRECAEDDVSGDWTLVFDSSLPVYASTNNGEHTGFAVAVTQYDPVFGHDAPDCIFQQGMAEGPVEADASGERVLRAACGCL